MKSELAPRPAGEVLERAPLPAPESLTFEALAALPDHAIDVALGASLVEKDVHPSLDVLEHRRRLDAMAEPLVGRVRGLPLIEQVAAVSERFVELGFRGNVDAYYEPQNSLLGDVLERRTGIPITLSIVWTELAARAGVAARGVGFPGHFLVRVQEPAEKGFPLLIDAFEGGRLVRPADAQSLLRRALGEGAELHAALFSPASSRATLARLLTNLKSVWARRGEHARAFLAIDRILALTPDDPHVLRERAGVSMRLGADAMAVADLRRVLELEPEAPDRRHIQARIRELGAKKPAVFH